MRKTLHVALREFWATVGTKGFLIGMLLMPLMVVVMAVGFKLLWREDAPRIEGQLALVDPTGKVAAGVEEYLRPEAILERRGDLKDKALAEAPAAVRKLAEAGGATGGASAALDRVLGEVPDIEVVRLAADVDLEAEKQRLREDASRAGGRIAIAVIHRDAVEKTPDADEYGKYDLYLRGKLHELNIQEIDGALRHAIVGARIETKGLDRKEVETLTRVGRVRPTTVTDTGELNIDTELNMLVPMGFMLLIFISVMTGGQYIMTTTLEEKMSRVVEVLLSAVSPMQLMTGKIVGQMCVGLLVMGVYGGMGIATLVAFTLFGMVDPMHFFYLIVLYLIAYFILGSLMAAIGAAVNEMREAQTLMTPVMVTMMVPWLLWWPISQNPNSAFAVVTSFVPPLNTFVILLRITSTEPPPSWQIWLSIGIGVASVYGAVWFAAKVFRIGLLMYGKPPNFATLIRWVRMA